LLWRDEGRRELTISHFSMRVDDSAGLVGRQGLGGWFLAALGHCGTDPKTLEGCGWRRECRVGEESEFSGVLGVFIEFVFAFAFETENGLDHGHYYSALSGAASRVERERERGRGGTDWIL